MPTPNTLDPLANVHPQPTTSEEFGTNVGETILAQTDFLADPDFSGSTSDSSLSSPEPAGNSRCNLSHTEQKIRLAAGATLLGVAAFAPLGRNWRIGLGVLGAAQLVTGAMRYCPLWQALGIDTRKAEEI